MTAVKQIYDELGIPALAEKKVKLYMDKAFALLDGIQTPGDVQHLRRMVEGLAQRQS